MHIFLYGGVSVLPVVYVDGAEGTTGLRIMDRLRQYPGITLLTIDSSMRKNRTERAKYLNRCDIAILCLPDSAAREAVEDIHNPLTRILDASSAHRISPGWVYGLPELGGSRRDQIVNAGRVAVPGCHATGYILLTLPLVKAGLLPFESFISCYSITGYSGGGKRMIEDYNQNRHGWSSPRHYAVAQTHKHLGEMKVYGGLHTLPVFIPVVSGFYAGMLTTIPLHALTPKTLIKTYSEYYRNEALVRVLDEEEAEALGDTVKADTMAGKDSVEIIILGHAERVTVMARFDNLGKGSSGAAIQCLNLMLNAHETTGLYL